MLRQLDNSLANVYLIANVTFDAFGGTNALLHVSYHYSSYYSNNNVVVIWKNEILYDYAGHASLA